MRVPGRSNLLLDKHRGKVRVLAHRIFIKYLSCQSKERLCKLQMDLKQEWLFVERPMHFNPLSGMPPPNSAVSMDTWLSVWAISTSLVKTSNPLTKTCGVNINLYEVLNAKIVQCSEGTTSPFFSTMSAAPHIMRSCYVGVAQVRYGARSSGYCKFTSRMRAA